MCEHVSVWKIGGAPCLCVYAYRLGLGWDLDVRSGENELANGGVQGEHVHAVAGSQHHLSSTAVSAVSSPDQVFARPQHVADAAWRETGCCEWQWRSNCFVSV